MERSSCGGVVGREERVNIPEHVERERGVVQYEFTDEEVKRLVLRHARVRRVKERFAESGSFVQLFKYQSL